MSEELTLTACANDWFHVEQNDEHVGYVETVKIAGCEINPQFATHTITVTCSDWDIVRDLYPTLLIESAEWYNPPEDNDE